MEWGGQQTRVERGIARLVAFVERRPWPILLFALALAAVSVWLATDLRVVQDLKVLLPPHAPALTRLNALEAQIGATNDLVVEIRSPSREANIAFGEALNAKMATQKDLSYSIFHQDRTFFEDHALLYLGLPDLLDLRQRVIDRIKREVEANLNAGFEDPDAPKLAPVEDELDKRITVDDHLREYFETDEGRLMAIKARPRGNTTDLAFTQELVREVEGEITALKPVGFHPDMKVEVVGSYASRNKYAGTVAGDAKRGALVAIALLVLVLLVYFRRFRAVPLVMVPLLTSVVVALGYAELRYGYLNIVSAFIFAVLLGIGIDFGIHVVGRYDAERQRHRDRPSAMRVTLSTTGMSTLAGALSTFGVYGFLMVADFQGFAQFGELAAVGILAAVVSVFTVVPAFIVVFERRFGWKPRRASAKPAEAEAKSGASPKASGRRLLVGSLAVLALGLGWAAYSGAHAFDIEFEYNFNKLGPKPPPVVVDADSEPAADYRDAVGRETTSGAAVALTKGASETEAVHRALAGAMSLTEDQAQRFAAVRDGTWTPPPGQDAAAADKPTAAEPTPDVDDDEDDWGDEGEDEWGNAGSGDPELARIVAEVAAGGVPPHVVEALQPYDAARVAVMHRTLKQVFSLYSFVPPRQADKLRVIKDIRRRINAKRASLSAETKKKLADVERALAVTAPIGVEDLPAWVTAQLTDQNGDLDRFVLFRTGGAKSDYLTAKELHTTYFDLPGPNGNVETAGNMYIMPEMLDTVAADGPVVIVLALLVVLVTALVLFRTAIGVGAVVLTVVLAVLWLVGTMYVLGWKANFFNIIAIPLLLGMGQDYALHLYHRYQHDGIGNIRRVLRETGGAIFTTALTTIIGLSALLFANHRGLLSLAETSIVGLVFCMVAAVAVLPAILVVLAWLRQRSRRAA